MNIVCTICSDLITHAENIYVTICGHLFHYHCLVQWIERSRTCPQCRNKVTDKCMFRVYPTVSNESNSAEDAATLQSRLDNAHLELRQQKAKFREKDNKIASLNSDLKIQEEMITTYERQLVSFDSKVRALKEHLNYATLQAKEAKKLKEENENLKKNLLTLNGALQLELAHSYWNQPDDDFSVALLPKRLQKVLNESSEEVEQMMQGYGSDSKTIATFATALKRALCESESKKNEYRQRLHMATQQYALEKQTEAELQNKIKSLESDLHESEAKIESLNEKLKSASSKFPKEPVKRDASASTEGPSLNDTIFETHSNNTSFNTMVNKIENSDSPYLNLKQGGLLCLTALQRAPLKIPDAAKPSEQLYLNSLKNAINKRVDVKKPTSIFHKKEAMKMDSFDIKSPLDISYDGLGGHSKLDTFPVPKKSPIKSCIPKLSAKHKLKRPNPTGSQDIGQMLKKIRDK